MTWSVQQCKVGTIHCARRQPPSRLSTALCLQIRSSAKPDRQTGSCENCLNKSPVWQKEHLVILAHSSRPWGSWWVLGWLINPQASKQRQSKPEQVRRHRGPQLGSDESVMESGKNLYSPQWGHAPCLTQPTKWRKYTDLELPGDFLTLTLTVGLKRISVFVFGWRTRERYQDHWVKCILWGREAFKSQV